MRNSKGPWFLVWGVSLPSCENKIIRFSASLGPLRDDMGAKFRACSECPGARFVAFLSSLQHASLQATVVWRRVKCSESLQLARHAGGGRYRESEVEKC